MALNMWSDVSSISNSIRDDAILILRAAGKMQQLVTVFNDASGGNPRIGYQYNSGTVVTVAEQDDLTSKAFTPSADQTLTPAEIGLQFFITDLRAESESPESIMTDAARELGLAATSKIENDLIGDMASLTGGTVGAAGTAITWGYVGAAISQARNANKNDSVPLACVIHGYQAAVLAKSASIAGATTIAATGVADEVTRRGLYPRFMFWDVPIYQVYASPDGSDDFKGGVFPREAIALDWRRAIRIEGERDPSRRGTELNMSAVYAHGVWRPTRGIMLYFDATAPSS